MRRVDELAPGELHTGAPAEAVDRQVGRQIEPPIAVANSRFATALAVSSWALNLATVTGAVAFSSAAGSNPWSTNGFDAPVLLAFATVGALIASRRHDNAIGWLFCAGVTAWALGSLAHAYSDDGLAAPAGLWPATAESAWAARWLTALGWGLLATFPLLLFPDGRVPSPRWRPVAWVAAAVLVLTVGVYMVQPGPLSRGRSDAPNIDNPFGISGIGWIGGPLVDSVVPPLFTAVILACLAAVVVRFRRARGEERQQLKWFGYGVGLLVGVVIITLVLFLSGLYDTSMLFSLGIIGIPVSVGVAILRYRLYDIDVLINRTLVYLALTTVVVGMYVLAVDTLGTFFNASGVQGASLLATGFVAVLFQPLRQRLQRAVNHLLYGERDEPYAVLSRLGQRLEATLASDAVMSSIVETVREALKLPYVAIALQRDDGLAIAAASGTPAANPLRLPLIHQLVCVGELVLGERTPGEPFSPADRRLLEDLARQAGVAVHAVRLTADLQHARARLVAAREEERRRLRRDLHDGLGPQLAGVTFRLHAARGVLRRDPATAEAVLDDLMNRTQEAGEDVRRLVYGLRPPALDDLGLVGAIREAAVSVLPAAEPPVVVDAPQSLPPIPAAVEVAAYRIAQAALAIVARHARAQTCSIRLWLNGALYLEVRDDGRGLPPSPQAGVGLVSMRERAAELGGTCVVDSVPGGGTSVLARLPIPDDPSEVSKTLA